MSRTIWYVSGTRADYGLMRATLYAIDSHPDLELGILVTGMHLDPDYGNTVAEIEDDGFTVIDRIRSIERAANGAAMAIGIARMIEGFTQAMDRGRPDIVLLLGDRGEMLAGAIAAIHLDIPIAHIHGGERSGTVDEPVRHAISKLAHLHFVSTENAAQRLTRMGELPKSIFIVGAPGLVGLVGQVEYSRGQLAELSGFDPAGLIALFAYHSVLQEAERGAETTLDILDALETHGFQTLALMPNSDAGSVEIRKALAARTDRPNFLVAKHLRRSEFISWMAMADIMVGNSSAGIIEAATFGTRVLNVGRRQNMRERNANVVDVTEDRASIDAALDRLTRCGRDAAINIYGDGDTDTRIVRLLATLPLTGVTWKSNAY